MDDSESLRRRMVAVTERWRDLYYERGREVARLKAENADLLASWRRLDETHRAREADVRVVFDQNNAYYAEIQRLRVRAGLTDRLAAALAELLPFAHYLSHGMPRKAREQAAAVLAEYSGMQRIEYAANVDVGFEQAAGTATGSEQHE